MIELKDSYPDLFLELVQRRAEERSRCSVSISSLSPDCGGERDNDNNDIDEEERESRDRGGLYYDTDSMREKVCVEGIDYLWNDMSTMRETMLDEPTTKSKRKYQCIVDALSLHERLCGDMSVILREVVVKALFVFPLLSSCIDMASAVSLSNTTNTTNGPTSGSWLHQSAGISLARGLGVGSLGGGLAGGTLGASVYGTRSSSHAHSQPLSPRASMAAQTLHAFSQSRKRERDYGPAVMYNPDTDSEESVVFEKVTERDTERDSERIPPSPLVSLSRQALLSRIAVGERETERESELPVKRVKRKYTRRVPIEKKDKAAVTVTRVDLKPRKPRAPWGSKKAALSLSQSQSRGLSHSPSLPVSEGGTVCDTGVPTCSPRTPSPSEILRERERDREREIERERERVQREREQRERENEFEPLITFDDVMGSEVDVRVGEREESHRFVSSDEEDAHDARPHHPSFGGLSVRSEGRVFVYPHSLAEMRVRDGERDGVGIGERETTGSGGCYAVDAAASLSTVLPTQSSQSLSHCQSHSQTLSHSLDFATAFRTDDSAAVCGQLPTLSESVPCSPRPTVAPVPQTPTGTHFVSLSVSTRERLEREREALSQTFAQSTPQSGFDFGLWESMVERERVQQHSQWRERERERARHSISPSPTTHLMQSLSLRPQSPVPGAVPPSAVCVTPSPSHPSSEVYMRRGLPPQHPQGVFYSATGPQHMVSHKGLMSLSHQPQVMYYAPAPTTVSPSPSCPSPSAVPISKGESDRDRDMMRVSPAVCLQFHSYAPSPPHPQYDKQQYEQHQYETQLGRRSPASF